MLLHIPYFISLLYYLCSFFSFLSRVTFAVHECVIQLTTGYLITITQYTLYTGYRS